MAIVEVKCHFGQQTEYVKKLGKGETGHQRYRCFSCKRTFQLDYAYRACQAGIEEQVVDLAMNIMQVSVIRPVHYISVSMLLPVF
ncbi:transposase [Xenorhabdus sp. KJ12.1]|nr:transposase [Xenorhabdus sp. KJ12.1]